MLFGHLRLLLGMLRANRPWRLAARLYRALVAALAAGAYGVVTSDIWRHSAAMGWWRLTTTCVASMSVTIVAVIAAHGLWERVPAFGIVSLYLVLFALILAGAGLVISPRVLTQTLNRGVGVGDYVVLAWFVASLATVGGALGVGLESNEAVREAAYATSVSDDARAEEPRAAVRPVS